jgi:hypothetical protein
MPLYGTVRDRVTRDRCGFAAPQISRVRWLQCEDIFARAVAIGVRKSFDADPFASPCDDGARRILQSGRRTGAVPGIDPAARRGCSGLGKSEGFSDVGPLRGVCSFFHGVGCSHPYANDHRETCDISNISLNDFEKQHREAVEARKNVCAGRSARPYPAEIIRR